MKISNILIFLAIIFSFIEILYFGGNFIPHSKAEFFCDLIVFLMFGLGMYLKIDNK